MWVDTTDHLALIVMGLATGAWLMMFATQHLILSFISLKRNGRVDPETKVLIECWFRCGGLLGMLLARGVLDVYLQVTTLFCSALTVVIGGIAALLFWQGRCILEAREEEEEEAQGEQPTEEPYLVEGVPLLVV